MIVAGDIMQIYVLGFLFSADYSKVLLVKKNSPDYQADKFNGIGGKVEGADLTPLDAMVREFNEHTGVVLPASIWSNAGHLTDGINYHVTIFKGIVPLDITTIKSQTDEAIEVVNPFYLPDNLVDSVEEIILSLANGQPYIEKR